MHTYIQKYVFLYISIEYLVFSNTNEILAMYYTTKENSSLKKKCLNLLAMTQKKWNKVKTIKHLELTESESNEYQNWREATKVNFRGIFIASNQEAIRTPQ